MSTPTARVFLPVLRQLDSRLAIPTSVRVRLLRELESDLEELRNWLLSRGLTDDEARAHAQETLVPDQSTVRELERLHTPLYGKMTRHVAALHLRSVERTALALATFSVLVMEAWILLRARLLENPSPFLWPVLILGALLFAAILAKAFVLWIKRAPGASTQGSGGILGLALATLGIGVGGAVLDFIHLAGVLEASPELAGSLVPQWLIRECALLSIALLVALAGGLVWFLLTQWAHAVRDAHRQILGMGLKHPLAKET